MSAKPPTSGKGPRQDSRAWASRVALMLGEVGVHSRTEHRSQPGSPAILRVRACDPDTDLPTGGTAVLTLYSTGSWTWGGDADTVALAHLPLSLHGFLP